MPGTAWSEICSSAFRYDCHLCKSGFVGIETRRLRKCGRTPVKISANIKGIYPSSFCLRWNQRVWHPIISTSRYRKDFANVEMYKRWILVPVGRYDNTPFTKPSIV